MCGAEIKVWDFECYHCQQKYNSQAWAEVMAYMFDIGEYAYCSSRKEAFAELTINVIESQELSYRDTYNQYIEELKIKCFTCYEDKDHCDCRAIDSFYFTDFQFVSDNDKDAFFYHNVITLPNSKYAQSCYNCTKQYSLKCNMLAQQLLTLNKDNKPAYKLDTCEYIDTAVEIYSDDGAPF